MTVDEDRIARLEQAAAALAEKNRLERERQSKRPRVIDLAAVRSANQKHRHAEPEPTAPASSPRRGVTYVNALSETYHRGAWVPRDDPWWERKARWSDDAVLQVGDVGGPTVVADDYGEVVRRGCAVDGVAEVVLDVVRFAGPRRRGPRGALCPECHSRWRDLLPAERHPGLFVAQRLDDAGLLPAEFPRGEGGIGVHRIQHYPSNWRSYAWIHRVLGAADPPSQEPGPSPFWFLAPGPLSLGEDALAAVST